MAERYSKRPSEILGIEDGWTAYQLDLCCILAGQLPPERLRANGAGDRPDRPARPTAGDPAYQSLAGMPGVRKMKIPESGVW
jgi:hypothetical protein